MTQMAESISASQGGQHLPLPEDWLGPGGLPGHGEPVLLPVRELAVQPNTEMLKRCRGIDEQGKLQRGPPWLDLGFLVLPIKPAGQ